MDECDLELYVTIIIRMSCHNGCLENTEELKYQADKYDKFKSFRTFSKRARLTFSHGTGSFFFK